MAGGLQIGFKMLHESDSAAKRAGSARPASTTMAS